jgi:hypothetical protein
VSASEPDTPAPGDNAADAVPAPPPEPATAVTPPVVSEPPVAPEPPVAVTPPVSPEPPVPPVAFDSDAAERTPPTATPVTASGLPNPHGLPDIAVERPEVAAGAAFAGGILLALILKRLGH